VINKKEMHREFQICRHFIHRFNQRYMNTDQNRLWKKDDLKDYLNVIMTSGQIRKLNKYSKNVTTKSVHIGMGSDYRMVFRENTLITVKPK